MKIQVGMGSCGIAAGALQVWEAIQQEINRNGGETEISVTGCIGMCHQEPLVDIIEDDGQVYTYGLVDTEKARTIVAYHQENHQPLIEMLAGDTAQPHDFLGAQNRIALRNCGRINPESIEDYCREGGYQALCMALSSMTPETVIEQIKISGLRGRGGAGFPTWFKWNATRQEKQTQRYVVCNADEGDPGAFMDRSILESDPHTVVEGMVIAGYATGASQGIIYCRAEYPLAIKRLSLAIEQAYERKYLGENILNTGFSFDLRIKQGAGAFVCGEETALIASLEGERGMPRLKPPYPSEKGYWQFPTTINNVETLANIAWIIRQGGSSFAKLGTAASKGTKVFALAGKVKRGGLVEVPMGMSLREIIYSIGGGIKQDRNFKAVQLGGPSGGCIPEALLDTPVDYDSIKHTGAIMGSGGMIVVDDSTCMVDMARFFLDFTQNESCGKCVQCRIGTKRMLEILERICTGQGQDGDIEHLEELAIQVRDGSLCGLGQSAPNPVLTTIKYFREEYETHIKEKKCPALQCKSLINYYIDPERCRGCTLCVGKCPVNCISGEKKHVHAIDQERCIKCGTCYDVCPGKFAAVIIA